jgi:hypothetical protein
LFYSVRIKPRALCILGKHPIIILKADLSLVSILKLFPFPAFKMWGRMSIPNSVMDNYEKSPILKNTSI